MDIVKIISFVDSVRAEEFKRKNTAAMREQGLGGGCCSVTNKYFIKEESMSTIDRLLHDKVKSEHWFKANLKIILEKTEHAISTMLSRAKDRGM